MSWFPAELNSVFSMFVAYDHCDWSFGAFFTSLISKYDKKKQLIKMANIYFYLGASCT